MPRATRSTRGRLRTVVGDGVAAGTFAGAVSGVPSTVHAVATGGDPLAATWSAGRIVARGTPPGVSLFGAAAAVHVTLSLGWGTVLAALLPRRHTLAWGVIGGLSIAALDLGVVGRRIQAVRSLEQAPQVADHVAYGLAAAWVVQRRRRARSRRT